MNSSLDYSANVEIPIIYLEDVHVQAQDYDHVISKTEKCRHQEPFRELRLLFVDPTCLASTFPSAWSTSRYFAVRLRSLFLFREICDGKPAWACFQSFEDFIVYLLNLCRAKKLLIGLQEIKVYVGLGGGEIFMESNNSL